MHFSARSKAEISATTESPKHVVLSDFFCGTTICTAPRTFTVPWIFSTAESFVKCWPLKVNLRPLPHVACNRQKKWLNFWFQQQMKMYRQSSYYCISNFYRLEPMVKTGHFRLWSSILNRMAWTKRFFNINESNIIHQSPKSRHYALPVAIVRDLYL